MSWTNDAEESEWMLEAAQAKFDLWRLCDELSVNQAVLLIIGRDPSREAGCADNLPVDKRPAGYVAAKAALTHAILSGDLRATIRRTAWERGFAEDPDEKWRTTHDIGFHPDDYPMVGSIEAGVRALGVVFRADPDWDLTTVRVQALRDWLAHRGFQTGFFFPRAKDAPNYLDAQHPRYAPKLAAAVRAWLAVEDPKGKHPKQALMKWLREHSSEFGLSDDDGKPNEQGIEECAKVANWQPGGGAPKTPGA